MFRPSNQDTLNSLLEKLRELGSSRIIGKELSENDNSKNQVYFGPSFDALTLFPTEKIATDGKGNTPTFKAPVRFSWLDDYNIPHEAPHAQLILYPKYPEVRFSGFLRGCKNPPSTEMRGRQEGRVLLLGITDRGKVYGKVVSKDAEIAKQYHARRLTVQLGVFNQLHPISDEEGDSEVTLLKRLASVHRKEWIPSQRMHTDGEIRPYRAINGIGYTLEAEFGIIPNGYTAPDYLGWEMKSYTVQKFGKVPTKVLSLFTPEPDSGEYKDNPLRFFMEKYGYLDNHGTLRFNGAHFHGQIQNKTGLVVTLDGFDYGTKKILKDTGGIILANSDGEIAARWSFAHLLEHWCKKHSKAVYVPGMRQSIDNHPHYHYSNKVHICKQTDFEKFLAAFSEGHVYYDPAPRITSEGKAKKRSMFRTKTTYLPSLYYNHDMVNTLDSLA